MKPADIIATLKAKDAKILGDVPEKRAEHILKAALTVIRESIVAAEKGDHPVAMLGRFKVNEITKGEGAEAVVVRKVVFIPAKPADKEGAAAEKAPADLAASEPAPAEPSSDEPAPAAKPSAFAPLAPSTPLKASGAAAAGPAKPEGKGKPKVKAGA